MLSFLAIVGCQPVEEIVDVPASVKMNNLDNSTINVIPNAVHTKLSKKIFATKNFKEYKECLTEGDCGYDGYGGFDGKLAYNYNHVNN